jgi:peptide deformylase
MALLKLRIAQDRLLHVKAKKIRVIDASIQRLAADMVETMYHENGVGLAANQIGVLQRICVIQVPEDEQPRILVNPEIVETQGRREVDEGCLSVPGYRGTIFRSETVKVRAQDLNGKIIKITAQDLLAQALEHEIDHLNGTLYLDHLQSRDDLYKIEPEPQEPPESQESVEAGVG